MIVAALIYIALGLRCQTVTLASFSSLSSDSCLGPGFTETIPPQEELSQCSIIVLQPSNVAIYIELSFRCNGTLVSLTIPSQVRGSDYSWVDYTLEPLPSIWRLDGTGYKCISVSPGGGGSCCSSWTKEWGSSFSQFFYDATKGHSSGRCTWFWDKNKTRWSDSALPF